MLQWTFFFHLGNAALLHNGLLGMPLAPALAGYPFAARPPGTSSKKMLLVKVVEQISDIHSVFFCNLFTYLFCHKHVTILRILYL